MLCLRIYLRVLFNLFFLTTKMAYREWLTMAIIVNDKNDKKNNDETDRSKRY